jgi:hypothetical protein
VTAALEAAGIRYAVIGGNAVAAWVARVDPSATRSTKDVDLLVEKSDLDRITGVMAGLGFQRDDVRSLIMFIDPEEPSRRGGVGVQLVWANELIRPSYVSAAPSVTESVRDPQGFAVLDLPALVRMKLTSNRPVDQVHVEDLLRMELIDDSVRSALPPSLRDRLDHILQSMEE